MEQNCFVTLFYGTEPVPTSCYYFKYHLVRWVALAAGHGTCFMLEVKMENCFYVLVVRCKCNC